MLEEIYFFLVIFIFLICLVILKSSKDHKKRAVQKYLEEIKIQEELTKSKLGEKID
jgi:hypothetical protein